MFKGPIQTGKDTYQMYCCYCEKPFTYQVGKTKYYYMTDKEGNNCYICPICFNKKKKEADENHTNVFSTNKEE